jgi:hypothetical protein
LAFWDRIKYGAEKHISNCQGFRKHWDVLGCGMGPYGIVINMT